MDLYVDLSLKVIDTEAGVVVLIDNASIKTVDELLLCQLPGDARPSDKCIKPNVLLSFITCLWSVNRQ